VTDQVPPPQFSDQPSFCAMHAVSGAVCGGPHRVVRTDLGDEVLAPSESPVGTPISEMSEEEQQKVMEAEANAQRDDNG
jgi:hypothetical protein